MVLIPGTLIMSSQSLTGDYFEKTVILLVKVSSDGVVGFVINKLFHANLNELADFASRPRISLYEGGPMDQEHLFFIHGMPTLGGDQLMGNMYFGGDFQKVVNLFQEGKLSVDTLKIFIGYCGWDFGQLETEIAEGDWQIMVPNSKVAFSEEKNLWVKLMRQYAN